VEGLRGHSMLVSVCACLHNTISGLKLNLDHSPLLLLLSYTM
jgi:hypothetical protein